MSQAALHQRMDKLGAAAAKQEGQRIRCELRQEYRQRLAAHEQDLRKRLTKEASESYRTQISALQRQVQEAERKSRQAAEKAAKEVAKQSQREIALLKERTERERAQHTAETARLKVKVDDLSLRLERQTSEQLGEMGEIDAYTALRSAFPGDDIQRIGRGVRGADIIHRVLAAGKELGRIIYECKNVSTWQNEWVSKAKKYRTQYQTPWVIIATRTFPRRQKSFVVERGVPVIDLRLVVRLAEVVRAAVLEVGQLRMSQVGRNAKADQMFDYILSDDFVGRFRGIADAVSALREHQAKERQWHAEAWHKQEKHYCELDNSRQEIDVRVHGIAEGGSRGRLHVVSRNR
jgi:hypothetical protein